MKFTLKSHAYLRYLLIPAILFLVAGGVARLITNQWTPLYWGLVGVGIFLSVIWIIYLLTTVKGFWRKRSTQAGTNALISTVSLIILLGLINFLVVRYTTPIDLTENQLYTLSSESKTIVQKLDKPTTVWIFDKEPSAYDRQLLENYQRYNPLLKFEYVDPSVNLALAEKFKVKTMGEVYLESGEKQQFVQNLIEYNQKIPLSEIKLTNAIERIRQNYSPTAYFLQGHGELSLTAGEGSLSQAVNRLKDKGYQVEPLNLSQQTQIPPNTDVIIIASPKSQLFPQELTLLKSYLDQGGNLLLMVDPNTDPGLDDLLKDWGVQLDPRIVIDASGRGEALGFGPATVVITNYGDHPITKPLNNGYSIYPLTRPIGTVKVEGVEAISLVTTDDKMWGESNLESTEITFDPNTDIGGPFDIGVALKRTSTESSESKMVVLGNATFATDGWFDEQFNGDVFLNSVQWLVSTNDDPLSIRPKEAKNRRINLTPLKARIIAWMSLVIMPILGLSMAGIIWWKRR